MTCLELGREVQFVPVKSVKINFLKDTFQICLWLSEGVSRAKGPAQYLPLPGPSRFAAPLLDQLRTVASVTLAVVVRLNWLWGVSKCIHTAANVTYLLFHLWHEWFNVALHLPINGDYETKSLVSSVLLKFAFLAITNTTHLCASSALPSEKYQNHSMPSLYCSSVFSV